MLQVLISVVWCAVLCSACNYSVAVVVERTAKRGNRKQQQTISYLTESDHMEDGISYKVHSNHNGFRT